MAKYLRAISCKRAGMKKNSTPNGFKSPRKFIMLSVACASYCTTGAPKCNTGTQTSASRPLQGPEVQSRRALLRLAMGAVNVGAPLSLNVHPAFAKKQEAKVDEYELLMKSLANKGKTPVEDNVLAKYNEVKPNCKEFKIGASSNYAEGTSKFVDCKTSDKRPIDK
ncbi:hypothetical protein CYMTET_53785 [Cymbomonas tetramitiformis]|uniref:Uncharacterized protein n=1 Tax=Cymbomonas tetramitiformis TaxID=36881 RepID=A0AAE0EQ08_9CHLO|nr:hypothetical protein CYMTET_53785 [Cymbomonas tetramitiformis]